MIDHFGRSCPHSFPTVLLGRVCAVLTSVVAAFADEKRKAQDVDDNDEDASGLADVVGQGHDEHDEELSGMEDLPEEGEQEEGEQDDEEVYDGEEGHHSYAQWGKEYDERWPLEIHLSQAYLDAQAASHGVTDDQRADLKDWTHSCAM